ncbi:hypothetical protein I7I48_08425 [Histoplasma ohiense]|nr:hypothetical protein I7I48_08425 [Histoplasma ohiense (nom. inval.)]
MIHCQLSPMLVFYLHFFPDFLISPAGLFTFLYIFLFYFLHRYIMTGFWMFTFSTCDSPNSLSTSLFLPFYQPSKIYHASLFSCFFFLCHIPQFLSPFSPYSPIALLPDSLCCNSLLSKRWRRFEV